jgi:3-deoxy-manno-octulosonate cytidylyltransferase (CMP-KDO synthetase)
MKIAIVIPARYKSTRFPGKPLVEILGKSLIQHVWEKCILAIDSKQVYIATDDLRIENHCKDLGMQVIMTKSNCLTGTDRVYQASKEIDADYYINVQGDEPLICPEDIKKVISSVRLIKKKVLINAQCEILKKNDFLNPNVPKIVTDSNNFMLYISRAPIPSCKTGKFSTGKKQVCIYGFSKLQLEKFGTQRAKSLLENQEDIEILRFLELGYRVKMVDVSSSSIAVDVPEDIELVIDRLTQNNFV